MSIYNELIDIKAVNEIARVYSPLKFPVQLRALLNIAYPLHRFEETPKHELVKILNQLLVENFLGEQIIKHKLFEIYYTKKSIVGAFEIKINNSRADFVAINGTSTSYEIKTGLDNLSKFKKQALDYNAAFEYNNLVIDEIHLENAIKQIPENFGLWIFKNGELKKIQKATTSTELNPTVQLNLLTKYEIRKFFTDIRGKETDIEKQYTPEKINYLFKKALKERYANRWNFVVSNQEEIMPIDVQFFFSKNVPPNIIYHV